MDLAAGGQEARQRRSVGTRIECPLHLFVLQGREVVFLLQFPHGAEGGLVRFRDIVNRCEKAQRDRQLLRYADVMAIFSVAGVTVIVALSGISGASLQISRNSRINL